MTGTWNYNEQPLLGHVTRFEEIRRLSRDYNQDIRVFMHRARETAPDARAELISGYDDDWDHDNPSTLYITGGANDHATGTGIQQLEIFGIANDSDGNPDYVVETFTPTADTAKECATTWITPVAMKGTRFGSGGAASGDITAHDEADSQTYMTIASGEAATSSARVYVASGWKAKPVSMSIDLVEVDGSAPNVNYGIFVAMDYHDGGNKAKDLYENIAMVYPLTYRPDDAFTREEFTGATGAYHAVYIDAVTDTINKITQYSATWIFYRDIPRSL